jgi:hypothetical protein
LHAAFVPLCRLLEEVSFTPPEDEIPMNFLLDCNGTQQQSVTVYKGDIASFPELPGSYYRIPNISAVGYALLPSGQLPDTARGRMEQSSMLGVFAPGDTHVELRQDVISAAASAFFDMEKTETNKPDALSEQRMTLVFYVAAQKYFLVHYDGVLQYYGSGVSDMWYNVDDSAVSDLMSMLGPV